jgi:hypothetical protein
VVFCEKSLPMLVAFESPYPLLVEGAAQGVAIRTQARLDFSRFKGVPEPVVSDPVKALRRDVLKEAPQEFNARQPLGSTSSQGARHTQTDAPIAHHRMRFPPSLRHSVTAGPEIAHHPMQFPSSLRHGPARNRA